MNYILDTHALIWFMEGSDSLSLNARRIIEDKNTKKYISIASIWEIAIKISIGKLVLQKPLEDFLGELLQSELIVLPITFGHILKLSSLHFFHKDPFDRIIVSQALEENHSIITKDPNFAFYKPVLIW